ncbi:MAG: histidinol dehydrogenase [Firmicutes bacterium]|nr:histidinol dehydrogenase [Bacillota bacterium]MDY2920393.1 histidinol dehydrogenase [Lentihominibacter sp.]
MKIIKGSKVRQESERRELAHTVAGIIDKVRNEGDAALKEYNSRFDDCSRETLRISREEIEEAYRQVGEEDVNNIRAAAANIRAFAEAQRASVSEISDFSPVEGVLLGHRIIPVESCCCYVPGGGYPLYSTALMLGIPAAVAGVRRIVACSPVIKGTDRIHPLTLVAMDIAGINEIYAVGGAQAVAAMAYGTDEIKPVNLLVGPGNSFVTEAKKQCYGKIGIDFLAGPSEVLIISDGTGRPEVSAADILAQSEHDYEAKGILVTTDEDFGRRVIEAVEEQLKTLETAEKASRSWEDYGEVIVADSLEEAIEYANSYAPEHLEVNVAPEITDSTVQALYNYGSLFIGENTAEVFGDYASGTNHTLPTMGAARYTGGVWVGTFLKTCTHQRMTKSGTEAIAPLVSSLARGEGLMGHAKAAEIRIETKNRE